jgi:hypothetical protein
VSKQKQSGEILYRAYHDEGTHLASSRKTKGRVRGNLQDDNTNKHEGNAEFEPVYVSEYERDNSSDDSDQLEGVLTAIGIIYLLANVAPPVTRWLQNEAVPTIKEKWKILRDKTKDMLSPKALKISKFQTIEIVTASGIDSEMDSHRLEEAYEKYKYDMTSEEAQREVFEIFIHLALAIKKLRKLSNARIVNEGAPGEYLEGQKIAERLTTPEFIGSIIQILENNPQLMEENTAVLSDILGRNLVVNGQYVPIKIGKFKEAMTLWVDECDDVSANVL